MVRRHSVLEIGPGESREGSGTARAVEKGLSTADAAAGVHGPQGSVEQAIDRDRHGNEPRDLPAVRALAADRIADRSMVDDRGRVHQKELGVRS
jgi:hypothetical protein